MKPHSYSGNRELAALDDLVDLSATGGYADELDHRATMLDAYRKARDITAGRHRGSQPTAVEALILLEDLLDAVAGFEGPMGELVCDLPAYVRARRGLRAIGAKTTLEQIAPVLLDLLNKLPGFGDALGQPALDLLEYHAARDMLARLNQTSPLSDKEVQTALADLVAQLVAGRFTNPDGGLLVEEPAFIEAREAAFAGSAPESQTKADIVLEEVEDEDGDRDGAPGADRRS